MTRSVNAAAAARHAARPCCSPEVRRRALEALALLAASGEPGRRELVLARVAGERAVLGGSAGTTTLPPPGRRDPPGTVPFTRRPAAPAGPGCVAALSEQHDGVVLADLLAAGVTSVLGEPARTARLLAVLALDALSGGWCEPDEVLLVGFGGDVPSLPRLVAVDSLAPAAAHRGRGRGKVSLVAVAPGALRDGAALAELLRCATADQRRETALLLPCAHPAAGLLVVAGPGAAVPFLPARLSPGRRRPRQTPLGEAVHVGSPPPPRRRAGAPASPLLIRDALRAPALPVRRWHPPRPVPGAPPPGWAPVEVAVLGPVELRGAVQSFDRRPTLTELVAYLALHSEGATTATWATAVWPDRRVPLQTIANRLSEARRALGPAADGLPRLRRRADRHVLVDVTTDWERFRRLAAAGSDESRHAALELVRGRPFANLRSGSWTVLDGLEGEIVAAVTACARDLAESMLARGEADRAARAARRGLRVAPWDERLHRLLMRAADAVGDRAGIDAVLRRLAAVLETDGDPLQAVHPETAALYSDLTTRPGV